MLHDMALFNFTYEGSLLQNRVIMLYMSLLIKLKCRTGWGMQNCSLSLVSLSINVHSFTQASKQHVWKTKAVQNTFFEDIEQVFFCLLFVFYPCL